MPHPLVVRARPLVVQTLGGGEVCLSLLKVTALRRGQHDMYVYVFVCYETITPNSGVKSDKHFHIESIHPTAKERSPALAPGP